jgi:hypothetical protein
LSDCRADCVLALDSSVAVSLHQEVTTDHSWVVIPSFQIVDWFAFYVRKSKGGCGIIYTLLVPNLELMISNLLLPINNSDNG